MHCIVSTQRVLHVLKLLSSDPLVDGFVVAELEIADVNGYAYIVIDLEDPESPSCLVLQATMGV